MSVNYIDIPGRLRSVALDGQVAGANQLYDEIEICSKALSMN